MGESRNVSIDLSDLDTTAVSWSGVGDEASAGLYAMPTAGGITLTDPSAMGKGSCGGAACQGRPIQWCCVNCH
ncbi:hypothetical protein [Micromonospora sp. WMMA1947]|uniref:hypothetical protein n=1 Tax=Micromonospora sp. WMMA1947 TaxID=3015163 RepID=UPI00248AC007|nr:hypothetical protein [Micromonospora sp. WMMA1947]WBC08562.1 hypothetical protein O7604_25535 [Micromonospora sp. WMMA1947]